MTDLFDDARLDDPDALHGADSQLRWLAESGARVRIETDAAAPAIAALDQDLGPRAIVVAGTDARLLRAVLEPVCPVPFVAWPGPGLPGWAGALDLVVVLDPVGQDPEAESAVGEAVRRGCALVACCPVDSRLADQVHGRHTTMLPAQTGDALAAAVAMLAALHRLGVGPEVAGADVAAALDQVAVACSPHRDLATNEAKNLALAIADSLPLVWGGSVLAARAGRRVAEALRRSSGRPALAADAGHLMPVLDAARPRDVFADPAADGDQPIRPALLVLADGAQEPFVSEQRGRLTASALAHGVRVEVVDADAGPEMARYAALLATGLYVATYLGIGLGTIG